MGKHPHIARSALRHGVTIYDVESVIDEPISIMLLPRAIEIGLQLTNQPWDEQKLAEAERVNVLLYAGFGVHGQELVVFLDRFENRAFHTEPAERNFGWMFWVHLPEDL